MTLRTAVVAELSCGRARCQPTSAWVGTTLLPSNEPGLVSSAHKLLEVSHVLRLCGHARV